MAPKEIQINSTSSEETIRFARELAGDLGAGDIVAFYGELGAGKTTCIQAICRALGVEEPVTSPSFTIVQEYQGRYPVFHFDFYRLASAAEVNEIGFEDYVERDGICLIEWPEVAEELLPPDTVRVWLETVYSKSEEIPSGRIIRTLRPQRLGSEAGA